MIHQRLVTVSLALSVGVLMAGCSLDFPADTTVPSSPVLSEDSDFLSTDTTLAFADPPAPNAGREPLPVPADGSDPDEIDCDNAEDLCDSGAFACDDIADYCDIGPDGGELPDDWDWDE